MKRIAQYILSIYLKFRRACSSCNFALPEALRKSAEALAQRAIRDAALVR